MNIKIVKFLFLMIVILSSNLFSMDDKRNEEDRKKISLDEKVSNDELKYLEELLFKEEDNGVDRTEFFNNDEFLINSTSDTESDRDLDEEQKKQIKCSLRNLSCPFIRLIKHRSPITGIKFSSSSLNIFMSYELSSNYGIINLWDLNQEQKLIKSINLKSFTEYKGYYYHISLDLHPSGKMLAFSLSKSPSLLKKMARRSSSPSKGQGSNIYLVNLDKCDECKGEDDTICEHSYVVFPFPLGRIENMKFYSNNVLLIESWSHDGLVSHSKMFSFDLLKVGGSLKNFKSNDQNYYYNEAYDYTTYNNSIISSLIDLSCKPSFWTFNSTGTYLLIGVGQWRIIIFNLLEKKVIHDFSTEHKGRIKYLEFSRDDKFLLSVSDNAVKVWKLDNKEYECIEHYANVREDVIYNEAKFSSDNKYLLLTGVKRSCNENFKCGYLELIEWEEDKIVLDTDKNFYLYDPNNLLNDIDIRKHNLLVMPYATISPDDKYLLVTVKIGDIIVINFSNLI